MKKLILLFCMILLVGTVSISAFEFDNYKDYNEETRTMTIRNGFTFGTVIAEVELKTPLNYYVPRGYQKVAEFEVRSNGDYNNAFKELELFDKKKGDQKFLRDYDFKSLSYETITIFLATYLGNAYETLTSTAIFADTLASQSLINVVMNNIVKISLGVGALSMVILFAKFSSSRGRQDI